MKLIALLMLASVTLLGCTDSKDVRMIKNIKIGSCPNATIGQMVEGFIVSPRWESGKSSDGKTFVNVGGDILYSGRPVHALMQFVVDMKRGQVELQALEFNQEPQTNALAEGFLGKMCQRAGENEKIRIGSSRH